MRRNFHLLLNLNKWKIITDGTVTHGTVTQNLERSHWGLSLGGASVIDKKKRRAAESEREEAAHMRQGGQGRKKWGERGLFFLRCMSASCCDFEHLESMYFDLSLYSIRPFNPRHAPQTVVSLSQFKSLHLTCPATNTPSVKTSDPPKESKTQAPRAPPETCSKLRSKACKVNY